MKKKLLIGMLAVTSAVVCAFGVSACGDEKDQTTSGGKWGETYTVQTAYAAAQELGYAGTLEEFVALISGKDGADGKDGVGIKEARIDSEGNLILVLTDGQEKNCGKVTAGSDAEQLAYSAVKRDGEIISYTVRGLGLVSDTDLDIPAEYNGKPVTAIGVKAFENEVYLTSVKFGENITLIDKASFASCVALTDIYYGGTKEQWNGVEKGRYWDNDIPAYTVHCKDGDVEPEKDLPLSAEEWESAVLATAYAENCKIVMTDNQHYEMNGSSETRTNSEIAKYDLANGLAYWYKSEKTEFPNNPDNNSESLTECYSLFGNGIWNEYYQYDAEGWIYDKQDCQNFERDFLYYKFGIGHGYDAIEQLRYFFSDDMFLGGMVNIKDMREYFEYNGDGAYTYSYEETDGPVYSYTISFKDGYISNLNIKGEIADGDIVSFAEMNFVFSDYGTTELSIPQDVIDNAVEKNDEIDKDEK